MITIPIERLLPLFFSLMLFYDGYNSLVEPLTKAVRGKRFDFEEALATSLVGLLFMVVGAIATLVILNW